MSATPEALAGRSVIKGTFSSIDAELSRREKALCAGNPNLPPIFARALAPFAPPPLTTEQRMRNAVRSVLAERAHEDEAITAHHHDECRSGLDSVGDSDEPEVSA